MRWQLCIQDPIPNLRTHPKPKILIHIMMIHMIRLHHSHMLDRRVSSMMEKVMHHVVGNVPDEGPTEEDSEGAGWDKEGEGGEDEGAEETEHDGWHYQAVMVHWEEMVDSVEEEVDCEGNWVFRKQISHMKKEAVKDILQNCPSKQSSQPKSSNNLTRPSLCHHLTSSDSPTAHQDRSPEERDEPPRCLCEYLQLVGFKEPCWATQVPWQMNLSQVILFAYFEVPHLSNQRSVQVQELFSFHFGHRLGGFLIVINAVLFEQV